jgi:hypothetical protein
MGLLELRFLYGIVECSGPPAEVINWLYLDLIRYNLDYE